MIYTQYIHTWYVELQGHKLHAVTVIINSCQGMYVDCIIIEFKSTVIKSTVTECI